ncbi:MAG: ATP-binding protein [Candidatus Zixiibacteriota bacterium]
MTFEKKHKIFLLSALIGLTVAIHYGLVLEHLFGHSAWVHAIHGRFCYIPIVIGAAWFGLRGGLIAAASISVLVLPYIFSNSAHSGNLAGEFIEIFFYFAIASLTGALIDKEMLIRRKHDQAQLQLERTHKLSMVGQLAAGVAHEIKNPLASIKGAVEILVDESTPSANRTEFKDIAVKEIKRVDRTIGEFLDFARPKEIKFEKIDVSTLLNTAARQLETQFGEKGIRLNVLSDDGLYINGDYEKMHQILLNLLLNAADASDRASAIELIAKDNSDGNITLSVRDNGCGIRPEQLDRIFEPFYTTKAAGTGLGLAIVKSIVERHGGTINIESLPGKGTTVNILLHKYKGL